MLEIIVINYSHKSFSEITTNNKEQEERRQNNTSKAGFAI